MATKSGDIYVYGVVRNEQSEEQNSFWGEVSLSNIKNQINALPSEVTDIVVHIHSGGGDVYEGFAIHDFLKASGKKITTRIEGLCASIATIIALAGETREMTANSTFMIHNPSMGIVYGDADDMEKVAGILREVENKIISFYSDKTGQTKEILDDWMKEEKFMTPAEAKELGFITDVVEEIKMAAVFEVGKRSITKNDNNMTQITAKAEETLQKTNTLLDKIMAIFKKDGVVETPPAENNLKLSTADGRELEFMTNEQIINPGNQVRIDGKVAEDGEYIMADKTKVVVKDGIVESVTDDEGNEDSAEIVNTLNQRIVELEAQNKQLLEQHETLNSRLEEISSTIESDYVPKARRQTFATPKENEDKSQNPVAEAIARRKERETKK